MQEREQPLFNPERAERRLAEAGIDLLLVSRRHSVAYLTGRFSLLVWEYPEVAHCLEREDDGCDAPYYFAGLPRDLSQGAFVVAHRDHIWRGQGWIEDVRRGCCQPGKRTPVQNIVDAVSERGLDTARIGVEMNHLPAGVLRELEEALPRARFLDGTQALWRMRMVKTAPEIERLEGAYRIAESIYAEMFRTIRERGTMTVGEARALQMAKATEAGSPPLHFGYVHPQQQGERRSWGGRQETPITPGDILLLDMGLIHRGYTTDFGRVAVYGTAPAAMRDAYGLLEETRRAAERAIRPGVRASEVFRTIAAFRESRGLPTGEMAGHGLGIECHEPPTLSPYDDTVIEEGMVLVPELGGRWDTVGFLLEDGGAVTADGWRSLTRFGTEIIEF